MFEDRIIADYLRRSYFAADGLWFVKAEERLGFDEALRLDVEVWRVLAKIQARKARELLGIEGRSLGDLVAALRLKFAAEGYDFAAAGQTPGRAEIEITVCPWVELLRKSGREHLAARVADAICPEDFSAWAREFDAEITVSFAGRICDGGAACRVMFKRPVL
jgi:hypothetical protein